MIRALTFLALLTLSACQSMGFDTPSQQIAAGCATASATLKTLTLANQAGELTYDQQSAVLNAVGYITPICSAPEPPTLDTLKLEAFTRAIAILQSEAAKL